MRYQATVIETVNRAFHVEVEADTVDEAREKIEEDEVEASVELSMRSEIINRFIEPDSVKPVQVPPLLSDSKST